MTNYAVVLERGVYGPRFGVRLEQRITLPFVPATGHSIGLCEHSQFRYDESKVKRVMWQHHYQEFHVELEKLDCAANHLATVRWHLERGWSVVLDIHWSDPNEAFTDLGDDTVIELDGEYYTVNDNEIECLKMDQREFLEVTNQQ